MAIKPSPKPQPIGQNADGSFIYQPVAPVVPITTKSTEIPGVGIPGVRGLTTPIAPSVTRVAPQSTGVGFSADVAKKINTPVSVKDSLGFSTKIDPTAERTVKYREYFDYLKKNQKLVLNDKQSDYIKRFKIKYPDYVDVPDTTLYGKVILADPKTEAKYGNINMSEFRIRKRRDSIQKYVDDTADNTLTSKVIDHGKKVWDDFGNTVIGAVDSVGSLMKIAENEINMFTGQENSFDNLTYAPAQEAIDRGLGSNLLRTGFSGTSTVLDAVPSTAAAQVAFGVMEDIPGLNMIPKALGGAMHLASEGVQLTGVNEEDANNIVGILGNLAFAKGGEKGQMKINKAYQEGGLKNAVYMTGLQVPQTVIDTALAPLNLGKGIYDTIKGFTKKTPGASGKSDFSYTQEKSGPQNLIGPGSEPVTNGLNPERFTVMKRDIAEKIIARQWKIKPTIRRDIRQKTGMSAEEFALKKNLVGDDVEKSLERTQIFKEAKMNEKADIISDWGEAQKTPAMEAMAISLRENTKNSITDMEGANSPKITGLLDGVNRFLQSPATTYQQIDALKSLYDHYNPDGLSWDVNGRLVNPIKHENAAWRRSQVQKIIEDEGKKRGVDIQEINKDIRGSHDLIKGLSAAEERMANNNIISLGDTQVAIMGALLGGDIAGVGTLAVKKMLGSQSATSYIAKKLYNTPNDQTNSLNSSSNNRPNDMIGRFTSADSTGANLSGKVNATPDEIIPVVSGPGMSLALSIENKTIDIKKAIEQYQKLSKEEQAKAQMNSSELVKILDANNRATSVAKFRRDFGYVDESLLSGISDKWATYSDEITGFIEKTIKDKDLQAIQAMNRKSAGLPDPVEEVTTPKAGAKTSEVVSTPEPEIPMSKEEKMLMKELMGIDMDKVNYVDEYIAKKLGKDRFHYNEQDLGGRYDPEIEGWKKEADELYDKSISTQPEPVKDTPKKQALPMSQKSEVKYADTPEQALIKEARKYKSAEEFIAEYNKKGLSELQTLKELETNFANKLELSKYDYTGNMKYVKNSKGEYGYIDGYGNLSGIDLGNWRKFLSLERGYDKNFGYNKIQELKSIFEKSHGLKSDKMKTLDGLVAEINELGGNTKKYTSLIEKTDIEDLGSFINIRNRLDSAIFRLKQPKYDSFEKQYASSKVALHEMKTEQIISEALLGKTKSIFGTLSKQEAVGNKLEKIGYRVNYSGSNLSKSKYLEVINPENMERFKIRFSDHDLPFRWKSDMGVSDFQIGNFNEADMGNAFGLEYVLEKKIGATKELLDIYNKAKKQALPMSQKSEVKYGNVDKLGEQAIKFENAVKNQIEKVFILNGRGLEDVSIIGSTARGKIKPNDLDILVTPRKKYGELKSEGLHDRIDLQNLIKDEIQSFFPEKKIHITISEHDVKRGPKISIASLYNNAKK